MKKISQLPSFDNWSDYIDKLLNNCANVTASECLQGEPSEGVVLTRVLGGRSFVNVKDIYWNF